MRSAAAVLLLTACVTTTTETRTKAVRVETEPEGAQIARVDAGQERNLGRTPLDADLEYVVEKREFDPTCWALPGVGAALLAGSIALTAATWSEDEVTAGPVIGITLGTLTFLGTTTTAIFCAISAGRAGETANPRQHDLRARLDGHEPQTVRTVVPAAEKERIILVPEGGE